MAGDELLREVLQRLADMPSELRQVLADQLWAQIAQDNFESASNPNQGANTDLVVPPRTANIFRVETILAVVPANQTATVVVGDLTIPGVPAGITELTFLRLQIGAAAVRKITPSGAGSTLLALSGIQLPPTSVLDR